MISATVYKALKTKHATYDKWAQQFKQKNGWTVVPKEAKPPVEVSNDERSAIEVFEFVKNPPSKYFLYVKEPALGVIGDAHTWTGESLGACHFGREYRDNFGGVRRSVVVYGINGRKYSGTFYKSAGDYARVKEVRS